MCLENMATFFYRFAFCWSFTLSINGVSLGQTRAFAQYTGLNYNAYRIQFWIFLNIVFSINYLSTYICSIVCVRCTNLFMQCDCPKMNDGYVELVFSSLLYFGEKWKQRPYYMLTIIFYVVYVDWGLWICCISNFQMNPLDQFYFALWRMLALAACVWLYLCEYVVDLEWSTEG